MDDDERRRRAADTVRRQQRAATERGRAPNKRGRHFHRGMAQLRGETREHGWRHEQTIELGPNRQRRHDTARTNERGGRDFTEYKSGTHVGGDLTMEQLAKDREILERDPNATGTWVLIQGAADSATRERLDALVRDYPGRFHVEEITRAEVKKALELGRRFELERNQLELVDSEKLRAQQRSRDRLERFREKARTQEAANRAVEEAKRERRAREERERTEREGRRQREAAERLAVFAREEREAAARGQIRPMTGREAADILAVSRPTPGIEWPHQEPPQAGSTSGGRARHGRERGLGRER